MIKKVGMIDGEVVKRITEFEIRGTYMGDGEYKKITVDLDEDMKGNKILRMRSGYKTDWIFPNFEELKKVIEYLESVSD